MISPLTEPELLNGGIQLVLDHLLNIHIQREGPG